jgi:hypothetical protein
MALLTCGDGELALVAGKYSRAFVPYYDELTITGGGRFDRKCHGSHDVLKYDGTVSLAAGLLVLHPSPGSPADAMADDVSRFRVVRWDERVYLVDVEPPGMQLFCNDVNQGHEPRDEMIGNFLLREGDWSRPVAGLPDVPPECSDMLLHSDLQARIVELVGDSGRINLGLDDGLREGMILIVRDVPNREDVIASGQPETQDLTASIAGLEARRCLVVLRYAYDSAFNPLLTIGLRVTSRAVDR